MRRLLVPLLIFLVAAGAFGWWWYQPEKVIARRTAALFESANVAPDSGSIAKGTRGAAIEGYLAPTITFEGPEGPTEEVAGPQKRDQIVSMYSALASICKQATIQDLEIQSVDVTGETAQVAATADAIIELPNDERPVDGLQHFQLGWRKIEGKWLLESAKWKETAR